jgi:hypothetical protein
MFAYLLFALAILVNNPLVQIQPEVSIGYAYYTRQDNVGYIYILDPSDPTVPIETIVYPTIQGWLAPSRVSEISPNGDWAVFYLTSESGRELLVQAFNFQTQEIRNITTLGVLTYEARNFSWSPDGSKIALLVTERDSLDVLVYSFEDDTAINLTQDESLQGDFAWISLDQLIAFTLNCVSEPPCAGNLRVFDTESSNMVSEIDLPFVYGTSTPCKLTPSPNGRWIAFISRCGGSEIIKDVFIWDIEANSLTQTTDLFSSMSNGAPFWSDYEFVWQDAQTLAIDAIYQNIQAPEVKQYFIYDVETATLTEIAAPVETVTADAVPSEILDLVADEVEAFYPLGWLSE